MKILVLAAMAATGISCASAGHADELLPMQDGEVQLGPVAGSIYFTDVPQGYRVVATLSERPDTAPVRFIATLRPGDTVTVSVPREAGQAPAEVLIRRVGNRLLYTRPVTTTARVD